MNKQALLEEMYNSAFKDELEKISGEVKIPKGGLKPGLLTNDLTQLMTPEDAKRVKKKVNVFKRSGPGLLPTAASGAITGGMIHGLISDLHKKIPGPWGVKRMLGAKGAIIGGLTLPALAYSLSRLGVYDKQAIREAGKLVKKSRE